MCSPTGTEEFDTSGFPLRFESKTRALAVSIDSRDIEQTCCLGAISRGGGQGNLDTKPRKLGGAGGDRFGVASERCHEARPPPLPAAVSALCYVPRQDAVRGRVQWLWLAMTGERLGILCGSAAIVQQCCRQIFDDCMSWWPCRLRARLASDRCPCGREQAVVCTPERRRDDSPVRTGPHHTTGMQPAPGNRTNLGGHRASPARGSWRIAAPSVRFSPVEEPWNYQGSHAWID